MSKSKSSRLAPAQSGTDRVFVALHQDQFIEALARGVILLGAVRPAPSPVDPQLLESAAHGHDYGVVGLVEVSPDHVAESLHRTHLLLSDCVAFWVRSKSEAVELEARLGLFGDTVPDGLPVRSDAKLFSSDRGQGEPSAEQPELAFSTKAASGAPAEDKFQASQERASADGSLIEKLSGAVSMLRWRSEQRSLPISVLAALLSGEGLERRRATEPPLLAFGSGVVEAIARSVAKDSRTTDVETDVVALAMELLAEMDPGDGIDPVAFSSRLVERVQSLALPAATETAEALHETTRKLVSNQLELTDARIDDTGQIGMRALIVFLLTSSPEGLARWLAARPEVGEGVSLVASMLVGVFSGNGRIPVQMKAPSREHFLATAMLSRGILEGRGRLDRERHWAEDGAERERLSVEGVTFAQSVVPPSPGLTTLLASARGVGLEAIVDRATGFVSVGAADDTDARRATATVRNSRWLPCVEQIAELTLFAKAASRAQAPRPLLEALLSPGMPPVWGRVGEDAGEVLLSAEVPLGERAGPAIRDAISLLQHRAGELGLSFREARKASPKPKAPRAVSKGRTRRAPVAPVPDDET